MSLLILALCCAELDAAWFKANYLPAAEKLDKAYSQCSAKVSETNTDDKSFNTAKLTCAIDGPRRKFDRTIEERLGELKRLCDKYGARLVFVVAPTVGQTYSDKIEAVASRLQFAVIPAPERGQFVSSDFEDGFHLNPDAAKRYSMWFSSILQQRLEGFSQPLKAVTYQQTPR